jgi:hypothetical protein
MDDCYKTIISDSASTCPWGTATGQPDVAAGGEAGIRLFTGKGDGTFNAGVLAAPLPFGPHHYDVAAADFNGDHNLDLVANCADCVVAVLFGNGNGSFQSALEFNKLSGSNGVAVGALTKGGLPGIALAGTGSSGTGAYLYYNNGAGGFFGPAYVNLPVGRCVAIGDINGDGIPDLVSDEGYVAFGTASGFFKNAVSYPVDVSGGTQNMVLADLRNDGLTDIVTDAGGSISVLLNQGNGTFEDGIWTSVTGGAGCGVSADFNLDGAESNCASASGQAIQGPAAKRSWTVSATHR